MQEPLQDVGAALVADRQAPVGQQPGQRPLDLPAMATQPGAGLHPTAGDPRRDAPAAQQLPAARVVIALITMQRGRSLARPSGPARGPMTAGTAPTSCSSSSESWVVAADNPTANRIPPLSIST
jgi:hypothetical protein